MTCLNLEKFQELHSFVRVLQDWASPVPERNISPQKSILVMCPAPDSLVSQLVFNLVYFRPGLFWVTPRVHLAGQAPCANWRCEGRMWTVFNKFLASVENGRIAETSSGWSFVNVTTGFKLGRDFVFVCPAVARGPSCAVIVAVHWILLFSPV